MMYKPTVSVLMPVRNEAKYLPAALASMLRQTMTDFELIIVDDGSTDSTPSIISQAASADKRIVGLKSYGCGLPAALNQGLERCASPLIARMDGDDISHPRRLEKQAAFMNANPHTGLVACSARHFPRQALRSGMIRYETWQRSLLTHDDILRDIYVESPFVHPAVMFRREAVEAVGGYRDMGWPEDYDLWLRMANAGTIFARMPEDLHMWRDRPERATRTMLEYSATAFRRCKLHHLAGGFLAGESHVVLAGAGKEGRAWHRFLCENRIAVVQWLDVDRRKTGRMLHGAPVISPHEFSADTACKMLVTIGIPEARIQARNWALSLGMREGKDFICIS